MSQPNARRSTIGQTILNLWSLTAVPLVAFLMALVVGAVVIVLSSVLVLKNPFDPMLPITAYTALAQGALGSYDSVVSTLVLTTPLLLAGLGVAIGFRAGLFNIGAQGQFLMGAIASVAVAIHVGGSPAVIAIPAALLGGMIAGAAWGFVPGLLKATSGAHEVVTTIMMNYVALAALSWLVIGPLRQAGSVSPTTPSVGAAALPIVLDRSGHIGIFIALAAVPIAWFLLFRTTRGFEIRAVGANPDAARYAGIKPRRMVVLTMSIAGSLAGLAGACVILGTTHVMNTTFSTSVGFDSITVALLGRSNPIGVLAAALLFGAMRAGAGPMQISAGVPVELVDFIQALILLFLIANVLLRRLLRLGGVRGTEQSGFETITRSYGRETVV
jgi:general nucleoside transport system permease protein